ncbi:hypothetical protein PH7735_04088 [Shimia thalassica]|uniref:Transposase n=1 Tax=Shimia thalassica TaxID=1715693 RepID=A0A0P1IJ57_9RHOB|nr:hypothetical protein PH7735_04088 [Shimia thalassica]
MRNTAKSPGEKIVKDIKRATRKQYSSKEKVRVVLDGLHGEDSIAELCHREGIFIGLPDREKSRTTRCLVEIGASSQSSR